MKAYPQSQILKETLTDWEDADIATYKLACALGIVPPEDGSFNGFRNLKWVFCSADPLGQSVSSLLDVLVEQDVLLYDENEIKFKWNPDFKITNSFSESPIVR